jgi:hypothetical protein
MLRLRRTTCWPVWFRLSALPRRSAVTMALSFPVAPSSEPTPSNVESAAAANSRPQWLWDICKRRGLSVVADVHVHPGGAGQSASDREHPMISRAGHVALILPDFARPPVRTEAVGVYRYLGDKRWHIVPAHMRRAFLHIGL